MGTVLSRLTSVTPVIVRQPIARPKRKDRPFDPPDVSQPRKKLAMGLGSLAIPYSEYLADVPSRPTSPMRAHLPEECLTDSTVMPLPKGIKNSPGWKEIGSSLTMADHELLIFLPALVNSQAYRLVDLPLDIIHEIGTHVDTETLHALTSSCHLLADMFTSIYLQRQDLRVPSPDDQYPAIFASTPAHFTALQVWRRSKVFSTLKRAHIMLHHGDADRQAKILGNFFDSVQDVIFAQHLAIHIDARSQAAGLAVLQRVSGCEELAVHELSCPWYDPSPPIVIRDIANFAARQTCRYPALKQIYSFESSTNILFTEFFLPWTMPVMQIKLTRLRLHDLSLSPDHWVQLLDRINIPTLRDISIPVVGRSSSLAFFLQRHSDVVSLRFTQTSKHIRLGKLFLPHLRELRGPSIILKSLVDALQTTVKISDLTIDAFDDDACKAMRDVLTHPACSSVLRLEIVLAAPEDTYLLKDLHLAQSQVEELTISEGINGFTFTETALMNCLNWIGQFPRLNFVLILDSGHGDERQHALRSFAESVRCLRTWEGPRELNICINWEQF